MHAKLDFFLFFFFLSQTHKKYEAIPVLRNWDESKRAGVGFVQEKTREIIKPRR